MAVSCFWFGLNYWAMLIGYSFGGAGRFDLLPLPWRVAATSLAVVYPVAALGLWLLVSWGPVLWVVAAATLLNLYWPILLEAERTRLEAGYFIWVSSFALLALSAFLTLRSAPR